MKCGGGDETPATASSQIQPWTPSLRRSKGRDVVRRGPTGDDGAAASGLRGHLTEMHELNPQVHKTVAPLEQRVRGCFMNVKFKPNQTKPKQTERRTNGIITKDSCKASGEAEGKVQLAKRSLRQ